MDDDEMERFEVTDYDLQHEFSGLHSRRKMTKEQQIYGMWADNSDGEDGEGSSSQSRPKFAATKGMSFVAGGVQQAGKTKKESTEQQGSPVTSRPVDSSDEEDFGRPTVGFNSKMKSARGQKSSLREGGIGEWERHTTGIGSKLMKMMGYKEGKGLGKNLQGISTPVEANKRKGKGAIGFYGNEVPQTVEEPEEKSKLEEKLQQWRKTGNKKKIKYVYKSAEEAIQDGRSKQYKSNTDSHITKTKVIDMTGPETRVLSSYRAIAGQKPILNEYDQLESKTYEHFDLPELIHNVQLLLEKSEEDIVRNAKELDIAENRIVHLNHESHKYDLLLEREEKEMRMMDGASEILKELEEKHKSNELTLGNAQKLFSDFKSQYPQIYSTYEMAYLAPTYISHLLRERLASWVPLASPKSVVKDIEMWKDLIEVTKDSTITPGPEDQLDPYHQLIWQVWTPIVRANITNTWNPKDSDGILSFLNIWGPPLIPHWVRSHLLLAVIMPRIVQAVNIWNPTEDTVPIHTWIHPWLPLLSSELQTVYPVIRQKLSAALVMWHPSDESAKMVLQPWKHVFSEISMTTLIQSNIQPKLESALLQAPISPHNQILEPWQWFAGWHDMLPTQIIVEILEKCFFPQWYQALAIWLSAKPPYNEVIAWYRGWRDIIPLKAKNHLQVVQKFEEALKLCTRALAFQPGAAEQFRLLLSGLENISEPPPPPPLGSPPKPKDWANIITGARRDNTSNRDLVEAKCEERGILFIPLHEKNHEGRPVYRCGNRTISFNKDIIYVQTDRGWIKGDFCFLFDE